MPRSDRRRVSHVLEGSVRKSGARLRITAQLVRTSDSSHVWSQTYERTTDEVFAVQTDIASQVAVALNLVLAPESERGSQTRNLEAYNLWLQGRYFDNRWQHGDEDRAIAAYGEAIKLDPNYVDAWLDLGLAYAGKYGDERAAAAGQLALNAAQRALAIDPTSARAHRVRGLFAQNFQWDFALADSEFKQALAAHPEPSERLRIRYAIEYLHAIRSGRFNKEYWPLVEEGARLNPLDVQLLTSLAFDYLDDGQLQKGIDLMKHTYSLNASGGNIAPALAYALMLASRPAEARKIAEGIDSRSNAAWQVLSMIAWSEGKHEESNRWLAAVQGERSGGDLYTLAQIHTWRGEPDAAFKCLDGAVRARDSAVLSIRLDPVLRRLQNDSRHKALIQRLKLVG